MRAIPFREVFDRAVEKHGRDPHAELKSDLRHALVGHINQRVRTICKGWRWPEWELTEERAFRQVWNATHQYLRVSTLNGKPDEVFYIPNITYYKVKASALSDPPVGTLPTNTTYFDVLLPVDSFIAYDQGCKRSIGMVRGVYGMNPRVPTGSSNGLLRYEPSEKGVDVLGSHGPTVFVAYSMPVPKYTMIPYVTGRTYPRGSTVFDPLTGECFQNVSATTAAPSDPTYWRWVPFLDVWEAFVVEGSFSDSLLEFDQGGNTEIQAKAALSTSADLRARDMLQLEVDALATQGQRLQWNFCKRRVHWCETLPWSGGTVSELTDACEDELGWVYPQPPATVMALDWVYHHEIVALLTADGAPSLEGLPTESHVIGSLVVIVIVVSGTPEEQTWRLEAGQANPLDLGQVTPADHDLVTNNKHWARVG